MWIGLSKQIEVDKLERLAQKYFHPKSVGVSTEFPDTDWPDIYGNVEKNDSEFPLLLNFYNLEGDENKQQIICIELAKYFSEQIGCRTICDGSGFGDDDSPYWCIVWEDGQAYLADDCGTTFGDGEPDKPVVIIRNIEIKT